MLNYLIYWLFIITYCYIEWTIGIGESFLKNLIFHRDTMLLLPHVLVVILILIVTIVAKALNKECCCFFSFDFCTFTLVIDHKIAFIFFSMQPYIELIYACVLDWYCNLDYKTLYTESMQGCLTVIFSLKITTHSCLQDITYWMRAWILY